MVGSGKEMRAGISANESPRRSHEKIAAGRGGGRFLVGKRRARAGASNFVEPAFLGAQEEMVKIESRTPDR